MNRWCIHRSFLNNKIFLECIQIMWRICAIHRDILYCVAWRCGPIDAKLCLCIRKSISFALCSIILLLLAFRTIASIAFLPILLFFPHVTRSSVRFAFPATSTRNIIHYASSMPAILLFLPTKFRWRTRNAGAQQFVYRSQHSWNFKW